MRTNQIRCSRYHQLPGNAGVPMTKQHQRCGGVMTLAAGTGAVAAGAEAVPSGTATTLIISVIRISSRYRFVSVDGADSRSPSTVGNRTEDL
ncbi:hypothetical protein Trydic_g11267 [Trypoxylus dichotomus]